MLYKEFKEKLEAWGLHIYHDDYQYINVYTSQAVLLAVINNGVQNVLYFLDGSELLSSEKRMAFYDLALEYAKTPVEERGEEKKYNVVAFRCKHETSDGTVEEDVGFYYRAFHDRLQWTFDSDANNQKDQQWTMKQIEHYGLEDYERIEVKGD